MDTLAGAGAGGAASAAKGFAIACFVGLILEAAALDTLAGVGAGAAEGVADTGLVDLFLGAAFLDARPMVPTTEPAK